MDGMLHEMMSHVIEVAKSDAQMNPHKRNPSLFRIHSTDSDRTINRSSFHTPAL